MNLDVPFRRSLYYYSKQRVISLLTDVEVNPQLCLGKILCLPLTNLFLQTYKDITVKLQTSVPSPKHQNVELIFPHWNLCRAAHGSAVPDGHRPASGQTRCAEGQD